MKATLNKLVLLNEVSDILQKTDCYNDGSYTKLQGNRLEMLVKIICRKCGRVTYSRPRDIIRRGFEHKCRPFYDKEIKEND